MVLSVCVFAQFPGMPGGASKATPNMGHVYGKLVDSLGKPVSDASVVLLQNKFDTVSKKKKDVLLKAVITKGNGEFNFEELPMFGVLKMTISATGFKTMEQAVSFMPAMDPSKPKTAPPANAVAGMGAIPSFDKDLGNIKLFSDLKCLQV